MSGVPEEQYVLAREALLDTIEALDEQMDAVVLVGAQAIYIHVGEAEFETPAYTRDADFCLNPENLSDSSLLSELMTQNGFVRDNQPGAWKNAKGIPVDLMVPEAMAKAGRRGARLGVHGKLAARRTKGLEAAIVDHELKEIKAFDPGDGRVLQIKVAGPAALLVAKITKIAERIEQGVRDRIVNKDALDVLRLLRAIETRKLSEDLSDLLKKGISTEITKEAISKIKPLFGTRDAPGVEMAVAAVGPNADAVEVQLSFTTLVSDLLDEIEGIS